MQLSCKATNVVIKRIETDLWMFCCWCRQDSTCYGDRQDGLFTWCTAIRIKGPLRTNMTARESEFNLCWMAWAHVNCSAPIFWKPNAMIINHYKPLGLANLWVLAIYGIFHDKPSSDWDHVWKEPGLCIADAWSGGGTRVVRREAGEARHRSLGKWWSNQQDGEFHTCRYPMVSQCIPKCLAYGKYWKINLYKWMISQ